MLTGNDKSLLIEAREAAKNAYAPYSSFKVGAALLSLDGKIFTGCNVENASYGLTVCAERVALFKAVSESIKEFSALALWAPVASWPCGACLQALSEFARNLRIISGGDDGREEARNLSELFPAAFRLLPAQEMKYKANFHK